ncbi:hypothetical protein COOONC_21894, partial [Cooperia oncophora]
WIYTHREVDGQPTKPLPNVTHPPQQHKFEPHGRIIDRRRLRNWSWTHFTFYFCGHAIRNGILPTEQAFELHRGRNKTSEK